MVDIDEPLFDADPPESEPRDASLAIPDRVRRLVQEQPFGVLCTQGERQPYGSLIAIAFTDDLKHAVFSTPITTRKYRLLCACDHVALLIDDRSQRAAELMDVEAVTVTGRSRRIERDADFTRWADLLLARHPYLKSFVHADTCALFRIDVVRYFHVARFQEVHQWSPTDAS